MTVPNFTVGAKEKFQVGEEIVLMSTSADGQHKVVFEDEGETGYFYAVDPREGQNCILDAMYIYDVKGVSDRHIPSVALIIWSADGQKASLLINNHPHAVFDFASCRGFCRDEFPPPHKGSLWTRHAWTDDLRQWFFRCATDA